MVTNICLVREQNEDNNRNKWKDRNVCRKLGKPNAFGSISGAWHHTGACALWRHWNLQKCLVNVNGENVLSCQTMCEDGMMVVLEAEQKAVIAETGDCYLYPADQTNRLVAACDIGTTTVVCHLLDGKTGVRLGTVSAPNAQRSFGADVISRIQAAKAPVYGKCSLRS